jgi:hypothetical protein
MKVQKLESESRCEDEALGSKKITALHFPRSLNGGFCSMIQELAGGVCRRANAVRAELSKLSRRDSMTKVKRKETESYVPWYSD